MEEAFKDERFGHILSDPRFRKLPKNIRKLSKDKRYRLKNKAFKEKYVHDKRGRPVNLNPLENLNLYDSTSSEEEEEELDISENEKEECKVKKQNILSSKKSNNNLRKSDGKAISEDPDNNDDSQIADIAEHEKDSENSESDSETESESDDSSGDQNEDFDHQWEELRNDAPDTDEVTRRIAVCNMDWDRIQAVDLFVCFNSFKPADGCINSVKIYPSEFGLKRMEEEKLKGPAELTENKLSLDEVEIEDKKGSKYHMEKLRQYQLNRLKYYFAVIDCDSAETANTLYEQLNGVEYESSSVRFDLRFIPDDMTFDHEPTSIADKIPDLTDYKPRLFVTSALQQVKVQLTWDETDTKRREFFQKVFTDPDSVQNEIQDYVASASSESEEETESADKESDKKLNTKQRIAKYKELLLSLEEKEKEEENKYDIEVTWEPDLKEKTEEKVKNKMKSDSLNPFEELLLKKKEEKKLKKKEHKALKRQAEDSDESREEFSRNISKSNEKSGNKKLAELALISDSKEETFQENLKRKKAKSQELEGFVGDMSDPRFSAMYTSSLFNMVPSDQHQKKQNNFGMKQHKERKFKRKNHEKHNSKRAKYS